MVREYVVNFNYFLLDINRYEQENLQGLNNLIGSVFALDQHTNVADTYFAMGYPCDCAENRE